MNTYDVVIYGATGLTGRQAARYFASGAGGNGALRWAIAGRDRQKLDAVHRGLPPAVGIIVADASDQAGIDRLVASTRVVLTTAGPYALHGEPLVRACARQGVDYVDITGETAHVRRLIDRYHREAARTGAKIVPFCGFDSVPSDLGALLLVEHFRGRRLGTRDVKGFFHAVGGFNGGSAATTLELWRHPDDVRAMEDPLLLNPDGPCQADERLRNLDPAFPVFDSDLGRWVAPFFMGPINTRVVRRSRALAAQWQADYGSDFCYQEYWDPRGPAAYVAASTAAWSLATYRMMARVPGAADLLAPFVPPPGQGPGEAATDRGYFCALFVGTADDGSKAWAELADSGDPAGRVTAKIACQSALALVLDRDRLPGGNARGGVLTPATALGVPLVARLRKAGMTITCPARPS